LVSEFSFALLESELEVVRMELMLPESSSSGCFLDPYLKKKLNLLTENIVSDDPKRFYGICAISHVLH